MSVLRVNISGEGLDNIVQLSEVPDENRMLSLIVNDKTYKFYTLSKSENSIFFEIGRSDQCLEKLQEIQENIAFSLPETKFRTWLHSTNSNSDVGYNFGCFDGKYDEWGGECNTLSIVFSLECDGISSLVRIEENEGESLTRLFINGREFLLRKCSIHDNTLDLWYGEDTYHYGYRVVIELAKALNGKKFKYTILDLYQCDDNVFECYYDAENDKVEEKYIGHEWE